MVKKVLSLNIMLFLFLLPSAYAMSEMGLAHRLALHSNLSEIKALKAVKAFISTTANILRSEGQVLYQHLGKLKLSNQQNSSVEQIEFVPSRIMSNSILKKFLKNYVQSTTLILISELKKENFENPQQNATIFLKTLLHKAIVNSSSDPGILLKKWPFRRQYSQKLLKRSLCAIENFSLAYSLTNHQRLEIFELLSSAIRHLIIKIEHMAKRNSIIGAHERRLRNSILMAVKNENPNHIIKGIFYLLSKGLQKNSFVDFKGFGRFEIPRDLTRINETSFLGKEIVFTHKTAINFEPSTQLRERLADLY